MVRLMVGLLKRRVVLLIQFGGALQKQGKARRGG
jgi:hypothetical protein